MEVRFFSRDGETVEQLALALQMRWPDLTTLVASQADVGFSQIEQSEPELVMICGDLPDLDRWAAIKGVREFSDVPVIVAAEGDGELEVVKALELGADDHIRLPSNLMEVMARVVALMRRVNRTRQKSEGSPIRCGDLQINPDTHEAYLGTTRLVLTPTEFRLLHLLAQNRHVTLPQAFIQRVVWSDDAEGGMALKKYIQRLRRKLGDDARNPDWIKTVHGVGYRFAAPASSAA